MSDLGGFFEGESAHAQGGKKGKKKKGRKGNDEVEFENPAATFDVDGAKARQAQRTRAAKAAESDYIATRGKKQEKKVKNLKDGQSVGHLNHIMQEQRKAGFSSMEQERQRDEAKSSGRCAISIAHFKTKL